MYGGEWCSLRYFFRKGPYAPRGAKNPTDPGEALPTTFDALGMVLQPRVFGVICILLEIAPSSIYGLVHERDDNLGRSAAEILLAA